MQTELHSRTKWTTIVEISVAMADYTENFYNTTLLQLTKPRTKNGVHANWAQELDPPRRDHP